MDRTPTGDDLLDAALVMIAGARHWMTRLSGGVPQLKERLLDRLIWRGVLRQDERHILGSGGLFGGFVVLLR